MSSVYTVYNSLAKCFLWFIKQHSSPRKTNSETNSQYFTSQKTLSTEPILNSVAQTPYDSDMFLQIEPVGELSERLPKTLEHADLHIAQSNVCNTTLTSRILHTHAVPSSNCRYLQRLCVRFHNMNNLDRHALLSSRAT
jgi:hypothetical protein